MAAGRGQREKLAKDLAVNDRLVRTDKVGTVLAVIPGHLDIKKPVLFVTVQMPSGEQVQATYSEHSMVTVEV